MTLELPADCEPFIPEGEPWETLHKAGCYVLRYECPEDLEERVDRQYDHRPEWFDQLQDAETVLYVGESSDVLYRLNQHNDRDKRLTTLSKIGCEPIGVVNVIFHDSKEAAEHAEYNTAKRVARQTDDGTLVIVNGEPA